MTMNYGIAMCVCLAKSRDFAKEKDWRKIYLNLLDYFTDFASECGLKIIEIASQPPFDADILFQIRDEIKEKIKKFETSYHLPVWEINICALNPYVRKASVYETKKLIDLAQELEIGRVSMHPGYYASMPDIYALLGQKMKSISEEVIFDIFAYCQNKDIELGLENLPYDEPPFQTPSEFEPFVEKGVGMILDTAHAVTSGIDPVDFIKKFGNKIIEVHLVDGFKGKTDIHYPLGTGEVDYAAVLNELERINFKAPVILELKSEEDTLESLKVLKEEGYL